MKTFTSCDYFKENSSCLKHPHLESLWQGSEHRTPTCKRAQTRLHNDQESCLHLPLWKFSSLTIQLVVRGGLLAKHRFTTMTPSPSCQSCHWRPSWISTQHWQALEKHSSASTEKNCWHWKPGEPVHLSHCIPCSDKIIDTKSSLEHGIGYVWTWHASDLLFRQAQHPRLPLKATKDKDAPQFWNGSTCF